MNTANFPFSVSDSDWCWRIRKYGYHLEVIGVSRVIYDNRLCLSGWSANRVIDFHRARLRLLQLH